MILNQITGRKKKWLQKLFIIIIIIDRQCCSNGRENRAIARNKRQIVCDY